MGNKKITENKSRRWFLSFFLSGNDESPGKNPGKIEKIKMLTPEGKLVEVDKSIFDKASKNKKATNKEILTWMKNPSKENS